MGLMWDYWALCIHYIFFHIILHYILYCTILYFTLGFPGVTREKNPPANAGDIRDANSTPGLGRYPGGEYGNTRQYSCLHNPMLRGACWATVHRVSKSQTQLKQLSMHTHTVPYNPLLKAWLEDQQDQHHVGACYKCRIPPQPTESETAF